MLAEKREREQRSLADALRDTAEALNSSLVLEDTFEKVLDKVGQVVQCDAMSVAWFDERKVRFVRTRGFEPDLTRMLQTTTFELDDFITFQRVVQSRRPLLIRNTKEEPVFIAMPMLEWVQSHVEAPVIIDEQVVGIINLDSKTPGFFNDIHARNLQAFANQVAIAVRNAQLYAETQRLTIEDPLTGLYNRRGLFNLGPREVERVKRFSRPLSVIFVDIDNFKQFNEIYGYEVGDQVLRVTANLISRAFAGSGYYLPLWRRGICDFTARGFTQGCQPCRGAVEDGRGGCPACHRCRRAFDHC